MQAGGTGNTLLFFQLRYLVLHQCFQRRNHNCDCVQFFGQIQCRQLEQHRLTGTSGGCHEHIAEGFARSGTFALCSNTGNNLALRKLHGIPILAGRAVKLQRAELCVFSPVFLQQRQEGTAVKMLFPFAVYNLIGDSYFGQHAEKCLQFRAMQIFGRIQPVLSFPGNAPFLYGQAMR